MPTLTGTSIKLPKPTRHWLLFEHMIFIPFCIFGLWHPLAGLAFVFSALGLFFSRDTESLPGPTHKKAQIKKGLLAFYTASLLSTLLMLFWPLDANWKIVPGTDDWQDNTLTIEDNAPLAVIGVSDRRLQLKTYDTQSNLWTNLDYPGERTWNIVEKNGAIWVIPSKEPMIYVYRNNSWSSHPRAPGLCDSFAVTDTHLWFAVGKLYQGDVRDMSIKSIKEIPNARYVHAAGDNIVVSDYNGWYHSEDNGKTWTQDKPAEEGSVEPFVSHDGRRYWVASNFFFSAMYVDAPEQTRKKVELPVSDPRTLVINPTDGKDIWISSWEGGVHRSLDGGETWVDMGLHRVQIRSMAIDFSKKMVFAASSNMLFDKQIFVRSF